MTASEVNVSRSVLAVTPMLEPLTSTFPASSVVAVTLPVVVIAVVISIPSNEPVNLPAPKSPTVVIVELPALTEYLPSAEVSSILSLIWVCISEVTLLVKFNLAAGAVIPDNNCKSAVLTPELLRTFNSAAVELTVTLLSFNPVISTVPFTLMLPFERVTRSASVVGPIFELDMTTLPILRLAAFIVLSPTSILPNPLEILPLLSAPTVRMLLLPSLTP